MGKTVIVKYGSGNIFSVQTALRQLGEDCLVTSSERKIKSASKVIFPGVGSAGAATEELERNGLFGMIPLLEQPVLGICLGMQLMFEESEEDDSRGFGIFKGRVNKLVSETDHERLKVPHMGWNRISKLKGPLFKGIPEGSYVYFVHSYFAPYGDYAMAVSNYGGVFTAAAGKNNFFGCQFHPEKSGMTGYKILKNFIKL